MSSFGVMEIFYGIPWSDEDRHSYASFLTEIGFKFYLYGPKGDETLRKNWHRKLAPEEFKKYSEMQKRFKSQGLKFGIILSPQGIRHRPDLAMRTKLQDKVKELSDVGLDYIGVFFDDMKTAPNLAECQMEIVSLVRDVTATKIIFCPSFYAHDPLLDILFGERPPDYLETLGKNLHSDIEILWTGDQVISPEITASQLQSIGQTLKRKPFICDNYFADDGPANCNFLRLIPTTGRTVESFNAATHWAINPMNQAHLSKLILRAFSAFALKNQDAPSAFMDVMKRYCSRPTAEILIANHLRFSEHGLSNLSDTEKAALRRQLAESATPIEREIIQWLEGRYEVGLDALLDQSCYEGQ